MHKEPTNPFTFGDLALDDAFTDREDEIRELTADIRNGQNVLVYAPRRYGKSSLVLRAAQEAMRRKVLVGYCDLMRTPTKERFAAALAKTIYADIASPIGQAFERAAELFRGLRVTPTIEVDPSDGTLRFTFQTGRRRTDIDDTIERLLELVGELAAERKRRVAIIFDEFQEILALDRRFPNLMRAVFQAQPEVSHVYLGSKRHLLERIFSDRNEPFWRSAKQLEIGMIHPEKFALFLRERFGASGKWIDDEPLARLLAATDGHPYATQELAYFTWELVRAGRRRHRRRRRGGGDARAAVGVESLRPDLGRRAASAAAAPARAGRRADAWRLLRRLPLPARAARGADAADRARGIAAQGACRPERRRASTASSSPSSPSGSCASSCSLTAWTSCRAGRSWNGACCASPRRRSSSPCWARSCGGTACRSHATGC